ncbi:hypothetical protein [Bacillus toyonensis]|nr:hypothetical protein [Bacillus toyonensis]MCU5397018.1 hypothetical protein [Bacillus toyonensis]
MYFYACTNDDTFEAVRLPTEEEKDPKQGVACAVKVTSSWNIPDG